MRDVAWAAARLMKHVASSTSSSEAAAPAPLPLPRRACMVPERWGDNCGCVVEGAAEGGLLYWDGLM